MIVCKIKLNARKDEVVESVTDTYWRETNVQRFNRDSTQRSSRQLVRKTFNPELKVTCGWTETIQEIMKGNKRTDWLLGGIRRFHLSYFWFQTYAEYYFPWCSHTKPALTRSTRIISLSRGTLDRAWSSCGRFGEQSLVWETTCKESMWKNIR